MVVFPVRIAGQSEETWEWNDEYCGAVERVDVAAELSDRICDECPKPCGEYDYEAPEPPIRLYQLIGEERLPAHEGSSSRPVLAINN
jgi:hypothetical protein